MRCTRIGPPAACVVDVEVERSCRRGRSRPIGSLSAVSSTGGVFDLHRARSPSGRPRRARPTRSGPSSDARRPAAVKSGGEVADRLAVQRVDRRGDRRSWRSVSTIASRSASASVPGVPAASTCTSPALSVERACPRAASVLAALASSSPPPRAGRERERRAGGRRAGRRRAATGDGANCMSRTGCHAAGPRDRRGSGGWF